MSNSYQLIDEIIEENPVTESERAYSVIKRIEQAKLYELLLKHDFFAPGSAREEIQDTVTGEIRGFILDRLEELMGIREEKVQKPSEKTEFDESQISALKAIADRLVSKNKEPSAQAIPQINQFSSADSEVAKPNQVQLKPEQSTVSVSGLGQSPAKKQKINKPEKAPRPEGGVYPGQKIDPKNPPKPMPSQAQIDQLHAREVGRRMQSSNGSATDQLINLAIQASQTANSNIKED